MHKFLILLQGVLCLTFASSCTKDFDIDQGDTETRYAIEGRISNLKGPYYVRVTKAANRLGSNTPDLSGLDNADPVKDALVVITDNTGLNDTLHPIPVNDQRYDPYYRGDRGFYGTTQFTGIPGRTYHLLVKIGQESFEASATMPNNVPAIDSVRLEPESGANRLLGDVAYAYFSEPQTEQNYYMLQLNRVQDSAYDVARGSYGTTSIFPYYAVDDKTLPAYVKGMQVLTILSDDYGHRLLSPHYVIPYDDVQIRLSCITQTTFDYFKALEKQFMNDGNVYKPSPASARGNISGNALGLFYTMNISEKVVLR